VCCWSSFAIATKEETMKHYVILQTMIARIAILSTMIPSATYAQTSEQAAEPVVPTGNSTDGRAAATSASSPTDEQPSADALPQALPPRPKPTNSSSVELTEHAAASDTPTMRTDRFHDGFYVRVSLGFGTQWTTIDDRRARPNYSAKNSALIADLLVGGAPSPGVVFGGALLLDNLPSTEFKLDGNTAKTGLSLITVGPFIDGYPNPRGGFHSGGMLGASAAHLTGNTYFPAENTLGVGLATWLGYDCWVADQWSVGGLLRFAGARVIGHKNSSDVEVYTRSIALLLTAAYQ
jgi:hypothetical protein